MGANVENGRCSYQQSALDEQNIVAMAVERTFHLLHPQAFNSRPENGFKGEKSGSRPDGKAVAKGLVSIGFEGLPESR